MADNYEVIFTHPTGATATFVRQGGELDALAKGLDSEQFWVFKNVKALLARNDPGDLREAQRMMEGMGFTALVRTSNCDPCHGHWTTPQISAPSDSGPPLCVHRSWKAAGPRSVRATTMRSSPTCTSFIWLTPRGAAADVSARAWELPRVSSCHLPASA